MGNLIESKHPRLRVAHMLLPGFAHGRALELIRADPHECSQVRPAARA